MKLFFTDSTHKANLMEYLRKLGRINPQTNRLDTYYLSALYILTSDEEMRRKCLQFVNEDGIDFEVMIARNDFSSGYLVLVELASHLFNERITVTPMEMIDHLDETGFQIALNAILARRFPVRAGDLE